MTLTDCSVNGVNIPNGERLPSGSQCEGDCRCEVRHNLLIYVVYFNNK